MSRSARATTALGLLIGTTLLAATPAVADPSFTPDLTTDVVGVGSDTTMLAMDAAADGATVGGVAVPGYNAGRTSARLASFDANEYDSTGAQTNSATIVLRAGHAPINRPNGSGAGKALLYGAGNNPDVDFARSSSAVNATESSAGLFAYPFAVDVLATATAATSNAPAALTGSQVLGIYNGTYTDWSQVGGRAGTIQPFIPQSGSGTRSFFLAQLKALNNGVDVVLAASVRETQEHSPKDIAGNPDAVAPFSEGRARLVGSSIKIEQGWSAKRAVYNVVRQADLGTTRITNILGASGFLCSPQAKPLIEAGGLDQLAVAADGGVCGEPTQSASTNFTTSTKVVQTTTTSLTGSNNGAVGTSVLTATVAAGSQVPQGRVEFSEDGVVVGTAVPVQGVARLTLSGVTAGTHSYVAAYVPSSGSTFTASRSASAPVRVLASTETVVPSRVLDTRSGTGAPAGMVAANGTIGVQIAGRGGVPAGVQAVALNVTAVPGAQGGWVTVWPGGAKPTVSNLNFAPSQVMANQVIAQLDSNGKAWFSPSAAANLLADVTAYFPRGTSYQGVAPARVADTRTGLNAPKGAVPSGRWIDVQVTGKGGVPSTGVGSVALNVTVASPVSGGYVTVWPTGEARPNASNINYVRGQSKAGFLIAKVGTGGKVSVYVSGSTNVIADVTGWYPMTADYTGVTPVRLLSTRPTPVAAGGVVTVAVAGKGGVPVDAKAVILNVTATDTTGSGWLTVWPTGSTMPNASTTNYTKGVTASNSTIAQIGTDGTVSIYTRAGANVLADVQGYFR